MKKIDLHIHTNISDGVMSPDEVVKLAKNNNCELISITDHDITADYSKLEKKYNIKIIPGIEFNSSISNLHLLGYNMTDYRLINKEMTSLRIKNEEVCYKVINLMQNSGYDISVKKINDYLKSINLNYDIIDKRKVVKYLIYKGYASSVINAYNNLIGKNQAFYVPNYKISPKEIIDLVSLSGGITVLAHPNTIIKPINELYNLVGELTNSGLKGIEVYNEKMLTDSIIYDDLANTFGLIKTVGSDFHNPTDSDIGININDNLYNEINKKLIKKKY